MGIENQNLSETQQYLCDILDAMKFVLVEKNKRYGNSALEPMRCFSKLSAQDSIKIRLDDKLKRIQNNPDPTPRINDCADVIGYLVLLLASIKADPEKIKELVD